MKLCPICQYHEGTCHLFSLLGTAGICVHCYEAHAEKPEEVHRAVQEMEKPATPDPFKLAIKGQLKLVTCWVSWEEGYLNLKAWTKRMGEQQLVVVKPTAEELEDEETAKAMAAKIIATAPPRFDRRPTLWQRLRAWWEGFTDSVHEIVDAGI